MSNNLQRFLESQKTLRGGGNIKTGLVPRATASTALTVAKPTRCCKPDCSEDLLVIAPARFNPSSTTNQTFGYIRTPIYGLPNSLGQLITPPRPCVDDILVFLFYPQVVNIQGAVALILKGLPSTHTFQKINLRSVSGPVQQLELITSQALIFPASSTDTIFYWINPALAPFFTTWPTPTDHFSVEFV